MPHKMFHMYAQSKYGLPQTTSSNTEFSFTYNLIQTRLSVRVFHELLTSSSFSPDRLAFN